MGFRHEVDPRPKPTLASLHNSIVDETNKQRFTIALIEMTQRGLLVDVVLPIDTQCLRDVRPCEISNPRAERQPSCGSASFPCDGVTSSVTQPALQPAVQNTAGSPNPELRAGTHKIGGYCNATSRLETVLA